MSEENGGGRKLAFLPLSNSEETEIAIVGGGLAGLLAAYVFAKEGKTVSVYEKYIFGEGQSVKMPDILQYDADRSLTGLKDEFGYSDAVNYYRSCRRAVSEIRNAADEVGYPDTVVKDCFTFSDGKIPEEAVEEEYRLRKYGGLDVELIDGKEGLDLFSFPFKIGIYSSKGGLYADKRILAEKLLCWLSLRGVRLYENTPIEYVTQKENGKGFYLETDEKISVSADFVLDCRGRTLLSRYPFLGRNKALFFVKTLPVTNFDGWYNRAFLRDMYRNPLYFTPSPSGEIILSGADSFFTGKKEGLLKFIFDKVSEGRISYLKEILSEYFYSSGNFVFEKADYAAYLKTQNCLPAAKEDPLRKGYYYLSPGNRNTLLSSWLCVGRVSEMINGKDSEDLTLLKSR